MDHDGSTEGAGPERRPPVKEHTSPPEGNPVSGVDLVREDRRERFLSPDEAERLCDAIDGLPDQRSADGLRLLLVTGARKMEVLASTWQEFDLVARTWTKPSARTKAKRRHAIPLADSAAELLALLRDEAGPLRAARNRTTTCCPAPGRAASWRT